MRLHADQSLMNFPKTNSKKIKRFKLIDILKNSICIYIFRFARNVNHKSRLFIIRDILNQDS